MIMDKIHAAQVIVAGLGPHPYYSTYRQHERGYWGEIPEWLSQHSRFEHVLDIGCAYGTLLTYAHILGAESLSAIDNGSYISPQLIEALFIDYHQMNVETEEYTGAKASHVILTETLEHFNLHPANTLRKIHDMMLPNGRLYLSTPNAEHVAWGRNHKYYTRLKDIPLRPTGPAIDDHIWHYNEGELLAVLAFAGFSTVNYRADKHITLEAVRA